MVKDVLISENGFVRNAGVSELLYDEQVCFRDMFLQILRQEVMNPNSEFLILLKDAMNTIANEEIDKVLE